MDNSYNNYYNECKNNIIIGTLYKHNTIISSEKDNFDDIYISIIDDNVSIWGSSVIVIVIVIMFIPHQCQNIYYLI
jgi:hypothetical protein